MALPQTKQHIQQTFDLISDGYDRAELRWFVNNGLSLARALELRGDEMVLDLAAGTGAVALALAPCLPQGQIIATDLSAGMLSRGRLRAHQEGWDNMRFAVMDLERPSFPPETFDLITSAFGLVFVDNMVSALTGIVPYLKHGGRFAISSFGEGSFSPMLDKFFTRMESQGVARPDISWDRLSQVDDNVDLLNRAGLKDVELHFDQIGYRLPDAEAWWHVLWNAGMRGMLELLDADAQQQFRQDHLAEISVMAQNESLELNVRVIHAIGRRP